MGNCMGVPTQSEAGEKKQTATELAKVKSDVTVKAPSKVVPGLLRATCTEEERHPLNYCCPQSHPCESWFRAEEESETGREDFQDCSVSSCASPLRTRSSCDSGRPSPRSVLSGASRANGLSPTDDGLVHHCSFLRDFVAGEELGSGRFGRVVASTRKADGANFACKLISSALGARDAGMEVAVLSQLQGHHGIVHIEAVYLQSVGINRGTSCGSGCAAMGRMPSIARQVVLRRSSSGNGYKEALGRQQNCGKGRECEWKKNPWQRASGPGNENLNKHLERQTVEEVQIVMQRCFGGTIAEKLKSQGFFPETQALRVLHSVLTTLKLLHSHGFVYRDIKDTNFLFLTDDPMSPIVAIDFGLATRFSPGQELEEVAGSPLYIAPEVVRRAYGPQCDVWSAAVLLHQMLCGRHPFNGETVTAVLKAVTGGGLLDLSFGPWAEVSSPTKQLLRSMLTQDPKLRPSPSQLLQCLTPDGHVLPDAVATLCPEMPGVAPNRQPLQSPEACALGVSETVEEGSSR